jgi:hypothetical protein
MKYKWIAIFCFYIYLLSFPVPTLALTVTDEVFCTKIGTILAVRAMGESKNKKVIQIKFETVDTDGNDIRNYARKINDEFIAFLKENNWQVVSFPKYEDSHIKNIEERILKNESTCLDKIEEIETSITDIRLEVSESMTGGKIVFKNLAKDPNGLFGKNICRDCFSIDKKETDKFKKDRVNFYRESLEKFQDYLKNSLE